MARRGRAVALSDLPLTPRRHGLRRGGLHGRRPRIRDARELRFTRRCGARTRSQAADGPRPVPYVDRAPVVPRAPGPVHLVGTRRTGEQLGRVFWWPGMVTRPLRARPRLVPALVLPRAARSRLAQPRRRARDAGRAALLAPPRCRR